MSTSTKKHPASTKKHPKIVSPSEWRAAQEKLLAKEKAATRARDALAAERRRLPMVRIDKDYRFEGPGGKVGLGRQESWEDSPPGWLQTPPYQWWRRHDEYGEAAAR